MKTKTGFKPITMQEYCDALKQEKRPFPSLVKGRHKHRVGTGPPRGN